MVTPSPPHLLEHPAFSGLVTRPYSVKAGYAYNGIGQLHNLRHDTNWGTDPFYWSDRVETPRFPWSWLHEEIYEWLAVAEAVRAALGTFTMIDLGAGYGRWLVAAACLARATNPNLCLQLVGVEAERHHFVWMHEHFRENGFNPEHHDLFEAAIDAVPGTVDFADHADPGADYGQHVLGSDNDVIRPGRRQVTALGINDLLQRYPVIDLLDMDIQGHERVIVPPAIDAMNRRVKRAYISTHLSIIDTEIEAVMQSAGWQPRALNPVQTEVETEFGRIYFGDGGQYWINPRLA